MNDSLGKDNPPLTGTQAWRQYGFTTWGEVKAARKPRRRPAGPVKTGFSFDGVRWHEVPKGQRGAVLWNPEPNWRPYWIRERVIRYDQKRED